MNSFSITPYKQWFLSYTADFISSPENSHTLFEFKREHSLRVAVNCREIAYELGWDEYNTGLAELLGLLHDTGRFSQYAEYGTFMDSRSLDHGIRGVEIVKKAGILDSFGTRDRTCIFDGIRLHNHRVIPQEYTPDSLPFVKLVRDADKLDILRLGVERLDSGVFFDHLRNAAGITVKGPATPAVIEDVCAGRLVSFEHITTIEDCLLMQISWASDINYHPTLIRMRENGYIERFARNLTDDISLRAVSSIINKTCANNPNTIRSTRNLPLALYHQPANEQLVETGS